MPCLIKHDAMKKYAHAQWKSGSSTHSWPQLLTHNPHGQCWEQKNICPHQESNPDFPVDQP